MRGRLEATGTHDERLAEATERLLRAEHEAEAALAALGPRATEFDRWAYRLAEDHVADCAAKLEVLREEAYDEEAAG